MLSFIVIASLLTLYFLVAGFALFMTYDELCKTRNDNALCSVVSFFACLFWPVTVLTALIAMRQRKAA